MRASLAPAHHRRKPVAMLPKRLRANELRAKVTMTQPTRQVLFDDHKTAGVQQKRKKCLFGIRCLPGLDRSIAS